MNDPSTTVTAGCGGGGVGWRTGECGGGAGGGPRPGSIGEAGEVMGRWDRRGRGTAARMAADRRHDAV
ncbi:MAG: hypothetical protein ACLQVF_04190 [Isosphaeraceae bacterium]